MKAVKKRWRKLKMRMMSKAPLMVTKMARKKTKRIMMGETIKKRRKTTRKTTERKRRTEMERQEMLRLEMRWLMNESKVLYEQHHNEP